jgi:uncharacterized cupin superfamily protein
MNSNTVVYNALDLPAEQGSAYPAPFDAPCAQRLRRRLGNAFGLKDFGANLLVLPPGAWSSQRHWHSREDELVYILEGTPTLVTDAGERLLTPGDVAGFPAGRADGHHLVNNSDAPVTLIEIGSRHRGDDTYYSDIDMQILGRDENALFTRRNGEPYEQ